VSIPCRTAYTDDGFNLTAVSPTETCVFNLWEAGYFSGDIRIDVHAKVTRGPSNLAYGMAFGKVSRNIKNAYFYLVNADGKYALLSSESDKWKTIIPWTANSNVKQGMGAENHLAAEISDRSIRLYINDKYVNSALTTSIVSGYVGLYTDSKINTAFRDVHIGEFSRSGSDDPRGPTWSYEATEVLKIANKWIGNNAPNSRNTDCVYGHSEDYVTMTRLPSSDAHCAIWGSTGMETVHGAPTPAHLRIEATARLLEGDDTGGYGIGFSISYAGLETEYFFEITGNGSAAVFSLQNRRWRRLVDWKQSDLIHTGYQADNYLIIEVLGLAFHCYVNGKYVASVGIPTPDVIDARIAVDLAPLSAGFKDARVVLLLD
jgi:hypothetical protein